MITHIAAWTTGRYVVPARGGDVGGDAGVPQARPK
jgi:hypothetical protein